MYILDKKILKGHGFNQNAKDAETNRFVLNYLNHQFLLLPLAEDGTLFITMMIVPVKKEKKGYVFTGQLSTIFINLKVENGEQLETILSSALFKIKSDILKRFEALPKLKVVK